MTKIDYSKLEKDDLLKVIEKLESRKKYGLVWDDENTKERFEQESENALPVLKEVKGKSITTDPSKPTNILIEGDNYHALSVLNYTHRGKIDVIYIDPPYNTGNGNFKYNDQYVDRADTYRHSKWLSFMSKRLRLAKSLLKDSGVIFISIDDNEIAQLKLLCDGIYGEENFITNFIWRRTKTPPRLSKNIARVHDYILCYAKNIELTQLNKIPLRQEYVKKTYKNPDNDPRGVWRLVPLLQPDSSTNKAFSITMPDGRAIRGKWRCSKETFDSYVKDNRLVVSKDGSPNRKLFLSEVDGQIADTWLDDIATNESASKEIEELFGSNAYFLSPKPTNLIKYLVKISEKEKSIILDFFAGSGTTGHAVLNLTRADDKCRTFILCTNDAELDHNGDTKKHKICSDVCYPRLSRVIKGYKTPKGEKIDGLGGNLKYYKTVFVKKSISPDALKIRITRECTAMLCLREGIFHEVTAESNYHIFQQNDRIMAVCYTLEPSSIMQLKKKLDKIAAEKILYCFTLDPLGLDPNDFADWQGVTLEPIPQNILDIYEQIYEY